MVAATGAGGTANATGNSLPSSKGSVAGAATSKAETNKAGASKGAGSKRIPIAARVATSPSRGTIKTTATVPRKCRMVK